MDTDNMSRGMRAYWRKKGIDIPKIKPGQKKGYKQSKEHIEKRKRFGENHHNWKGDDVERKVGWKRAERKFIAEKCVKCGEEKKRLDRHHIDNNSKNNSKENVMILCRKCHMKEDGRYDRFIKLAKENQTKAVASRWN